MQEKIIAVQTKNAIISPEHLMMQKSWILYADMFADELRSCCNEVLRLTSVCTTHQPKTPPTLKSQFTSEVRFTRRSKWLLKKLGSCMGFYLETTIAEISSLSTSLPILLFGEIWMVLDAHVLPGLYLLISWLH